jgi:GT2 family glycosyltransferase
MELSIIILNWNASADTLRCVRSFDGWKRLQPTLWVVDNASTDGSAEIIARDCPNARLIRNAINMGFAGGNNRGLIEALANSNAPIMLLNNDAIIAEADVISLLETLQTQAHIGVIGPLLFNAEQPDKLLTAGGQNMVWHLKSHIHKITGETVQIVDYVPGTAMLCRSEVFRAVGLLDEDYFFNGETPDLCHRAAQNGYRSAVDTRARAFHALSRSSNLRETLYSYYAIRNRFLFINKFYRPLTSLLLYAFWSLYSLALALKLYLNGKSYAASAVGMGLWDGLQGRFGGQNERVLLGNRVPKIELFPVGKL